MRVQSEDSNEDGIMVFFLKRAITVRVTRYGLFGLACSLFYFTFDI